VLSARLKRAEPLEETMTVERTDESEPTEEQIKHFEEIKKQAEKHFYFLIGLSITAWSSMEGYLVYVATMLLDTTPQKAGLVLYSTNFHSWLSIIHDLFNIDPSYHSLRSDWNNIENKLKGLNDVRVQLAHHAAVGSAMVLDDVVASGDTKDIFPILKANKLDTRSKTQKREALQAAELVKFVKDVGREANAIKALTGQMTPIYREQKKAFIEEVVRLQRASGKKEP
jgi:hypothetical protein